MKFLLLAGLVYFIGCPIALLMYLFGASPILNAHKLFWPVIFVWPALLLWPLYLCAVLAVKLQSQLFAPANPSTERQPDSPAAQVERRPKI
jgi:hypothetical protein